MHNDLGGHSKDPTQRFCVHFLCRVHSSTSGTLSLPQALLRSIRHRSPNAPSIVQLATPSLPVALMGWAALFLPFLESAFIRNHVFPV